LFGLEPQRHGICVVGLAERTLHQAVIIHSPGIQRDARSLGPYLRLRSRIGRIVTQEEVAEAVGISRNWYVRLETADDVRVSPTILGRVADVLTLNNSERAEMFRLAVPELGSVRLEPVSYQALEAFRSLRSLGQKLWAASSPTEAVVLLRQYAATQFTSDLVASSARSDSGYWTDCIAIGMPDACQRWEKCSTYISTNSDVTLVDEFFFGRLLTRPGRRLRHGARPTLRAVHAVARTREKGRYRQQRGRKARGQRFSPRSAAPASGTSNARVQPGAQGSTSSRRPSIAHTRRCRRNCGRMSSSPCVEKSALYVEAANRCRWTVRAA
jgi:transcriptional regulator with XRE-family HTH domain